MPRNNYNLAIVSTVLILAGIFSDRLLLHTASADASTYQTRVASVAKTSIPYEFDGWVGKDTSVPKAAVALLHPNVILARRYEHLGVPEAATFLLVQCKDIRDILGHYPPICYVAQGWTLQSAMPHDVAIDGRVLHCTRYVFTSDDFAKSTDLTLDDFILLPSGATYPDMNQAKLAARDHRQKYFGAAQIQVVYEASVLPEVRDRVFRAIVHANRPVIDAILTSVFDRP